jgi:hypothetical protein
MPYIFKNAEGVITGSASENLGEGWKFIAGDTKEYLDYLEHSLAQNAPFRESDIQLARVLEDLISILIDRGMLRFTDFPPEAQKRLNYRQSLRKKNRLSGIVDESPGFIY